MIQLDRSWFITQIMVQYPYREYLLKFIWKQLGDAKNNVPSEELLDKAKLYRVPITQI